MLLQDKSSICCFMLIHIFFLRVSPNHVIPLAGHFTQVVWKDSTELGVGMATTGNKVFVVGQYHPAGNINTKEYFEKNVGQLGNCSVRPNAHSPAGGFGAKMIATVMPASCFLLSLWAGLCRTQTSELRKKQF